MQMPFNGFLAIRKVTTDEDWKIREVPKGTAVDTDTEGTSFEWLGPFRTFAQCLRAIEKEKKRDKFWVP